MSFQPILYISIGIIYFSTGYYKILNDPILGILTILLGILYIKCGLELWRGNSAKK
ncbi:hypothetical protein [Methanobacterium sp. SMA-27]|uniref:hypothetical protein n=1 Tax=Methanobacterium sp. SMA-27 TaxID=1495336 RepID=UPI0012E018D4|nr:hypothetical protein [Methanobacterium sp. SMA-27]